jgi:DNA polymerase-4
MVDVPRDEVEDVSDALFDLFHEVVRAVEPGSMEEAFLDPGTSDWATAADVARLVRERATRELGIPVSVGIGRTKLMAKLASRAAKPDGLHVIGVDREAALRSSLALVDVWGLGSKTVERLRLIGAVRLDDIDGIPRDELLRVCGTGMARRLWRIREGTDDAELRPVESRSSLSSEGSISGYNRPDWTSAELLQACVVRVCRRAERAGLAATGLTITYRSAAPATGVVAKYRVADPTADPAIWIAATNRELDVVPPVSTLGLRAALTGLVSREQISQTLF